PASLELLQDGPVNCLLLKGWTAEFVAAANGRNLASLAVLTPGPDTIASARHAIAAKGTGIVLEGQVPEGPLSAVREAAGGAPVIELVSRNHLQLGSHAPIIGTYQGVWPGIGNQEDGHQKAGPSGSVWIDTNTGFIRAVHSATDATL